MKIGSIYEITQKNGDAMHGYTVYKKTSDCVVVGYDGLDGHEDFRREVKKEDIVLCEEVVV